MGNFCNKEYLKLLYLENDDAIIQSKLILYKIYYVKNKLFCLPIIKNSILNHLHEEFDDLILKLNTEYNKNSMLLNIKIHTYYPVKDKKAVYIKDYLELIDQIVNQDIIDENLFIFLKKIIYETDEIILVTINYCNENRKIRLKIDKYNNMLINYILELKNDAIERGIYKKILS